MNRLAITERPDAGATAPVRPTQTATAQLSPRIAAIDGLRTFLTLLVVAHHSALAYISFAPPLEPGPMLGTSLAWAAFPVVDPLRWSALDLFVGFNDDFFMSLMFLISGLFVWPVLARKGARAFTVDRLKRLGIPFVVAALLAPIAYFPTFLQRHPGAALSTSISGYSKEWLSLGSWPAGPAWFLWVLLAFDLLAASAFALRNRGFGPALGALGERPLRLFLTLLLLSSCVYLPLTLIVSPIDWLSFGPFFAQKSRLAHYALYFLVGGGISLYGIDRGIFNGTLQNRWLRWSFAAFGAFAIATAVFLIALAHGFTPLRWALLANLGFPLSCAASSLAFLAIAQRFWSRGRLVSMSRNAYGLYLLHYLFVSWIQYAFVPLALPAPLKFCAVFALATCFGLLATAALRKIRIVASVI